MRQYYLGAADPRFDPFALRKAKLYTILAFLSAVVLKMNRYTSGAMSSLILEFTEPIWDYLETSLFDSGHC